jgi:tetratricopeptide (TPR) repeat protein
MTFRTFTAATLAISIAAGSAFGAGSSSSAPPTPTQTTKECKKNRVWSDTKKRCVRIEKSLLDDDGIYNNARELAYAGRYDDALQLLGMAANPNDPRILNYKAFTNRKMGNVMVAMEFYRQALHQDPDYILARSYFGQAKMQSGDVKGAKEQLARIEAIDGSGSWAYESLEAAIEGKSRY